MVSLPRASVTVDDSAPALAGGTELCCVLAPVATQADAVPRQYGSAADVYAVHGYSEGLEYVAHHIDLTGRPGLFVGVASGPVIVIVIRPYSSLPTQIPGSLSPAAQPLSGNRKGHSTTSKFPRPGCLWALTVHPVLLEGFPIHSLQLRLVRSMLRRSRSFEASAISR